MANPNGEVQQQTKRQNRSFYSTDQYSAVDTKSTTRIHSNKLNTHFVYSNKVCGRADTRQTPLLMEAIPMCYELIKYKTIRQTHLLYLLFIAEFATCFDPAGSSSGLYVNRVMLKKNCLHLWDPR
jgi:hypothetical protein